MKWVYLLASAVVLAGCVESSGAGPRPEPLSTGIEVSEDEIVFVTDEFTVPAGQERYLCFPLTLDEDVQLSSFRTEARPVIHHLLFSRTLAEEPAGFSECDVLFRSTWSVLFAAGAGDVELQYPEGAAQVLSAGDQLLVQLHLLNATSEDITDRARVVMGRTFAESPRPVRIGVLGTSQFSLPPQQQSDVVAECTVNRDAELVALFPHMHQLGLSMQLELEDNAGEMQTVYVRDPYDFDQQNVDLYPEVLKEGTRARVTCAYENTLDQTVTYGESSTQEMCFLITFSLDRGVSCSGGDEVEEVPRDPAAGECGKQQANDEGVGGACTAGGDECPFGLRCTADQSQAGGGNLGFCMKIGCGTGADCGGGHVACCAPTQAGGAINICMPEACRPTDCIPL